jgi:hypothetical protein
MPKYVVTSYNLRISPAYEGRRTIVDADSAQDAIHAILQAPRYASCTSRFQRHPDAAARDNAHFQIDLAGRVGASAVRIEFDGREIELEAEQKRARLA